MIHRAQVVEKKWKESYDEEPSVSNEDFRSRWKKTVSCRQWLCRDFNKKIPVTEFLLVCCDCVLFSMAKSSVRVFVSVARTF